MLYSKVYEAETPQQACDTVAEYFLQAYVPALAESDNKKDSVKG